MITETKMQGILNGLIDDFIQKSSFFRFWKVGQVHLPLCEKFLISFDSLVKSFPMLIAAGIARTQDETTRCVLAVNLYEECGEGNASRTHHAIYRKFLSTSEISISSHFESRFAAQWRERLFEYIQKTKNIGSILGVLAAGEFLAQPALSRIYKVIQPYYPQADQEYFTKHLVLEKYHVQEITSILVREAKNDAGWKKVQTGFKFGLGVWKNYFNDLTRFMMNPRS